MIQLISDLHLSADDPALLDQFRRYAAQLEPGDELYILGDLFEYWLGDDAVEFLGHLQAEHLLTSISDRGVQLNFLTGNRDFLLGRSFADRCGMTLIADEHILNVGAERILLMHGDSLCTDDIAHQQFRTMVRTPSWQEGFLKKSVVERDAMAKLARYRSEDSKAAKTSQIMDVNSTAVDEVMRAHRVRLLIHGHTHRPAVHEIGPADDCYRIVLGDWGPGPSWIRLNETGLELQFGDTRKRLAFRGDVNGRY